MARYALESAQGYAPNNSVVPALINTPVIFQADWSLTLTSAEIWFAVSCADSNYGGCFIWGSLDGSHYERITKLEGQSTHGLLTDNLAVGSALDTVNTLKIDVLHGVFSTVSQQTVDSLESLLYVDGEFIAYRDALLTGSESYHLSYLKRGLYKTTIQTAATNSQFALCNDLIAKYKINPELIGTTVYFKFQGFNLTNGGLQALSDLVAYSFDIAVETIASSSDADTAIRFAINTQVEVTAPTIVGSILNVPVGTYTEFSAVVGCGEAVHTATLQLRKQNTEVVASVGGVAGGVQQRNSVTVPFTLTEVSTLDLVLFTDNAAAVAFVRGGYLK